MQEDRQTDGITKAAFFFVQGVLKYQNQDGHYIFCKYHSKSKILNEINNLCPSPYYHGDTDIMKMQNVRWNI
jgi:hypothetical protein